MLHPRSRDSEALQSTVRGPFDHSESDCIIIYTNRTNACRPARSSCVVSTRVNVKTSPKARRRNGQSARSARAIDVEPSLGLTRILRSYRYPRAATRAQWRCRAAQAGWRAGPQGALVVLRGWDLLSSPVLQPTAPLRLLRMGEAQRLLRATSRQPQPAAALPAGCGVALVGRVR